MNPKHRIRELEAFVDWLDFIQVKDREDCMAFPCGAHSAHCTNGADATVEKWGGYVAGICGGHNSATHPDTESGHDFAVVDGRFIVAQKLI